MKKFLAILAVCVLLIGISAGCGAAKSDMAYGIAEDNGLVTYSASSPSASYDEAGIDSNNAEFVAEADAKTVKASDNRKLVKTVSLYIQTKEYEKYLAALRTAIDTVGGYIEQSSSNSNGFFDDGNRHANITARIPSDKLDAFVLSAGENGKIVNKNENISDVTLDYVDTESRIKALKTERDTLMKLLNEAGSLENVIAIQTRISEVNYQLESYESQLRVLENRVSYSIVSMEISEVERVSAQDESLAVQIKTRLLNNLSAIRDDSKDFAVALIGGLPYLLIWGAGAVVIALIVRAAVKRRKKKKARINTSAPQ